MMHMWIINFFHNVCAGSPSRHSISEWRMQSIARDSEDSTDDEFFDAHGNAELILSLRKCLGQSVIYSSLNPCSSEGFSDNEEIFAKEITKWNSTDLMDKMETSEAEEAQGMLGLSSPIRHALWL